MNSRAWVIALSATRTESVRMYVISPTGPSSPISTPSYSRCADRAARREAQLLGGLLLHRAGGEGRGRLAPALAALHRGDDERQLRDRGDDALGGRFVFDLRLVPVELVQPRLERLAVLLEVGGDRPVLLR